MDKVLATASSHVPFFLAWVIGMAALFAFSALFASWLLGRRGWMNITPTGPRWFRASALIAALVSGVVIGMVAGVQVGTARSGLQIAKEVGPALLDRGLAIVCGQLDIDNPDEKIKPAMAREVLARLQDVHLLQSSGMKAALVNAAFERIRGPFLLEAGRRLDRLVGSDGVSIAGIAHTAWQDVHSDLSRAARGFTLTRIGFGYVWLVLLAGSGLCFAWVARRLVHKAANASERFGTGRS